MKEFKENFQNKELFTTRDVKLFLKNKKANKNYTSLFLNNLIKRQELQRINHGVYSFKKEIDFLEKAFYPSYHALQDALSLHKIWQQQTIPILITPRKIRTGERTINNSKILLRHINRKMFFGYDSIKQFDTWINVSNIEKTLIDFVYYNEPLDKESLKELIKQTNKEKLEEYLKKTNKTTKEKIKKIILRIKN